MSQKKKNDDILVLGPLGNGWQWGRVSLKTCDRVILVGGGVGIPPLYHLAQEMLRQSGSKIASKISVFLGGRHKSLLHCEKEFKKLLRDLQAEDKAP